MTRKRTPDGAGSAAEDAGADSGSAPDDGESSTEWLDLMLEEIERKENETADDEAEAARRGKG